MRIDIDPVEMCPVIKEVYSGAFIETSERNRIGFCMRDDTIEFNVIPKNSAKTKWYRVDMRALAVLEIENI